MPFVAALSEHPVTAHAVGEVAGRALERLGAGVDLALLFVTRSHAGALDDACDAARHLLGAGTLVGGVVDSVVGRAWEVEETAAVTLFAASTGPVAPMALSISPDGVDGLPRDPGFAPSALVVLADPRSFPIEELFAAVDVRWPRLPVAGGYTAAGAGSAGRPLLLDGQPRAGGAVGFLLGPGVGVETVVSQGTRPIGEPLVVTSVTENRIATVAGRPPLERLEELARDELSEQDVAVINAGGLRLGVVLDEHLAEFGHGDFLVRTILGGNRSTGAIAVDGAVEVGTTVQFHLWDAAAADDDLHALLQGRRADAALVFESLGRGRALFGERHHDAVALDGEVGAGAVCGFFGPGVFGPVGGRNRRHDGAASLALLRDATPAGRDTGGG